MLKRNIQVRESQTFGHQRDQVAHMRIGIDVMQPHPRAQPAQIAGKVGDMRAVVTLCRVFDINAIGRRVLRYHQQFPDPGGNQLFRLAHDGMGGA